MDEARKELHLAVKEAYDAGLCVVPPREDGSKAPEGYWGEFIQTRASIEILRSAYRNGRHGIGLITGKVSNNLECCEFETEEAYRSFKVAAALAGLDELVERIEAGYLERAPRGGRHWLWYSEFSGSGRKLAMVATGDPADPYETSIETRFEGQFIIVAPSHGPIHPTGKPYVRVNGSFSSIYHISDADRQALFRVAETFDQCPKSDDGFAMFAPDDASDGAGDRPGDDFNRRARWHEDVLLPAGWKLVGTMPDREGRPQEYWRRPNKDQGNSATLHPLSGPGGHGIFVPYSTHTPFPVVQRGYNKFRTYAFLHHEGPGRFRTATITVVALGYGKPKAPPAPTVAFGQILRANLLGSIVVPDVETLSVLGRDGLIMMNGSNLLYGFPKAGKTELAVSLVREWVNQGRRICYFTEEPLWFWKARLERLGLEWAYWEPLLLCESMGWGVAKILAEFTADDITVVDTLRSTAGYRENKVDEDVGRVVEPLILAARERGATLIAGYHARKMPGEDGIDISGHHSLFGAFDRAIQLRKVPGEENERKRRLTVMGRLLNPTEPAGFTYEMDDAGAFRVLDAKTVMGWTKTCPECRQSFEAKRSDAIYDSETCQKRARRREEQGPNVDGA